MSIYKEGWDREKVMAQIKKYNNNTKAGDLHACFYKTSGGNRCAIGAFIPDDSPALNYTPSVRKLLVDYPELENNMPLKNIYLLAELQLAHDSSMDGEVYQKIEKTLISMETYYERTNQKT